MVWVRAGDSGARGAVQPACPPRVHVCALRYHTPALKNKHKHSVGWDAPPLTVASFATNTTHSPCTMPMPVTTPALGALALAVSSSGSASAAPYLRRPKPSRKKTDPSRDHKGGDAK